MIRFHIICIAIALGVCPSFAATAKVEEVIKAFNAVGTDAAKLRTFCEMTKAMDAMGDNQNAADDAKIQGYVKQLGADFESAWTASSDVDSETADGRAIGAALDELSAKCA
jgi:hypothetical protein